MRELPEYWLTRPAFQLDEQTRATFDAHLARVAVATDCPTIDLDESIPKWQFLCYAAEHADLVLHGSGDPAIACFEPRRAHDLDPFGDQKAVYAASDGIWPLFFAIVDRTRVAMSTTNSCMRMVDPTGAVHGPYYLFSISQTALTQRPWRNGAVYLLPRATFVSQGPEAFEDLQIQIAQLASPVAVRPLAKVPVTPHDFPFLAHIRGHDDQRLAEYAAAMQSGSPWPDDPPILVQ
jgi:hypothetical protein